MVGQKYHVSCTCMTIACNICLRKVLSHAKRLICSFCNKPVHLSCLQNVSTVDSIYIDRATSIWLCPKCVGNELPFNHFIENDEFIQAISENWKTLSNFPCSRVQGLDFNPFEINDDEILLPINQNDPDIQYFNDSTVLQNIGSCDYYLEDTFVNKCTDLSINENSLSLMQFNIRSIPKNLDKLENYLAGLRFSFTVIGISETWLKESNVDCYSLRGYQHYFVYRENKSGGGVSIFVKEGLSVKARPGFTKNENCIESLFIELPKEELGTKKNTVVGMIYRPPNQDVATFTETLSEILLKIKQENKFLFLMGDFNINILQTDKHLPSDDFLDSVYSLSLFPLITKPTRITANTSTSIDNIF